VKKGMTEACQRIERALDKAAGPPRVVFVRGPAPPPGLTFEQHRAWHNREAARRRTQGARVFTMNIPKPLAMQAADTTNHTED
jgi:hypothetical protein